MGSIWFLFLLPVVSSANFKQEIGYNVALIVDAKSFCSGSLIREDYVLTTGKCVYGAFEVDVVLGLKNLLQPAPSFHIVSHQSIKIHDQFIGNPLLNDIALIKIPKLNTDTFDVHLLNVSQCDRIEDGDEFKLSEYNTKNKKSLNVGEQRVKVNSHFCQSFRGCEDHPSYFFAITKDESINSTGFHNIGSPVIQSDNLLVGITVFTRYEYFSYVLKLNEFIDWIHRNMK